MSNFIVWAQPDRDFDYRLWTYDGENFYVSKQTYETRFSAEEPLRETEIQSRLAEVKNDLYPFQNLRQWKVINRSEVPRPFWAMSRYNLNREYNQDRSELSSFGDEEDIAILDEEFYHAMSDPIRYGAVEETSDGWIVVLRGIDDTYSTSPYKNKNFADADLKAWQDLKKLKLIPHPFYLPQKWLLEPTDSFWIEKLEGGYY